LSSHPPQSEIEAEDAQISGQLVVTVSTEANEDELLTALNRVPELGSITAEALSAHVDPDDSVDDTEARPPAELTPAQPRAPLEPAQVAQAAQVKAPQSSSANKTIRIDVTRLDALLNLVGELVIDRTRLVQ